MVRSSEAAPVIRDALRKVAPDTDAATLDRLVDCIAFDGVLMKAGRSHEVTAPELKLLGTINRKIGTLMHTISQSTFVPKQLDFLQSLESYNAAVISTHRELSKAPTVPARKGCPPNIAAARVSEYAAKIYGQITGAPATRRTNWDTGVAYGPFYDLLSDIFRALDINANVEHYARLASMEKTSPRGD